jgi:hypothetical protein
MTAGLLVVVAVCGADRVTGQALTTRTAGGHLTSAATDVALDVAPDGRARSAVVSLANEGIETVRGVTLSTPLRDWSTAARTVARTVPPGATAEEAARALWQLVREETYHWDVPSLWTSEGTDPTKLLGVYGYGLCTQRALALAALWRAAGLPVRFWQSLGEAEHDVPEVWFDGRWHLLDPDRGIIFLLRDNRTIAGIDDLRGDPSLVLRAGPQHQWFHDILLRTRTDLRVLPVEPYLEPSHALRLDLWPGERVELHADPQAPPFIDEPASRVPPTYGTAVTSVPLVTGGRVVDAAAVSNLSGDDHLRVANAASPGEIRVAIERAFPLVGLAAGATVSLGPGDRLRLVGQRHADGFTIAATEFRAQRFRLPGVWTSDTNVATGMLPLQVVDPSRPGALVYTIRRRAPAEPATLYLVAYQVERAQVAVEVSADRGGTWTRIWQPAADERDYVQARLDLTPHMTSDDLQVRFHLDAGGTAGMGWTAALHRLEFGGVEGPEPTELAVLHGPFTGATRFVLTGALLPAGASAAYGLRLSATLDSPSGDARLTDLSVTLQGQASIDGLLRLGDGATTLRVEREPAAVASDVRVDVRWTEEPGQPAPPAPAAPTAPALDQVLEVPPTVVLAWQPVSLTGNDTVLRYHVQVCGDPRCLSPVTPDFEVHTEPNSSGDAAPTAGLDVGLLMERGRRYYWRVRAQSRESQRWGPFSVAWAFRTGRLPTLRIEGSGEMTAVSPFVTLEGALAQVGNVTAVRWRTSGGRTGNVAVEPAWRAAAVPVHAGANVVTITAETDDGREVSQVVRVAVDDFRYYLAEGAVDSGFSTWFLVANPNPVDAPVSLRLLTGDGADVTLSRTLKAWSRQVINARELLGETSRGGVSAEVVSHAAVPLVAERVMSWGGDEGAHAAQATDGPRRRWYFAEGAQGFFETFYLVVNPSQEWLSLTATFLLDGGGTVTRRYDVAPASRFNVWTRTIAELDGRAFAAILDGDQPFSTERSMYMSRGGTWVDGHGASALPWPSTAWYFAEGATGAFFDTFLLLANPQHGPANIRITYLLPDGRSEVRTYVVAARSRLTLHVDGEASVLRDTSVGFEVRSDVPVLAERAMYWAGTADTWSGTHASGGQPEPGLRWGLAAGAAGVTRAAEHFVLIANPDDTRPAVVRARYFAQGQWVDQEYTVPPKSRFTVWLPVMVPALVDTAYGTEVTSTNGVPILVESALYWNRGGQQWGAGANVPATRLPH